MPIIKDDFLQEPTNTNKLWRYMDLGQLFSLLEERKLFFCRADELGDRFEGSYPIGYLETRKQLARDSIRLYQNREATEDEIKLFLQKRTEDTLLERQRTLINCWHYSEVENLAMWELYAPSNKGIAVVSTIENLKQAFESNPLDFHAGKVRYIDYDKDGFFDPERPKFEYLHFLMPFINKRNFFVHENEYRIIASTWFYHHETIDWSLEPIKKGRLYDIDVEKLVQAVIVSPKSSDSFYEHVKKLVQKYLPHVEVKLSRYGSEPFF